MANKIKKLEINDLLNAKRECLALWKRLSKMPSQYINKTAYEFKLEILEELEIEKRLFGCPLCHRFNGTPNCPLGNCQNDEELGLRMGFPAYGYHRHRPLDEEERKKLIKPCFLTPYNDWQNEISISKHHNQDHAKRFYEYLMLRL